MKKYEWIENRHEYKLNNEPRVVRKSHDLMLWGKWFQTFYLSISQMSTSNLDSIRLFGHKATYKHTPSEARYMADVEAFLDDLFGPNFNAANHPASELANHRRIKDGEIP